jgi:hypothetical protein
MRLLYVTWDLARRLAIPPEAFAWCYEKRTQYFLPFLVVGVCFRQQRGDEIMAVKFQWQKVYQSALLELDPTELPKKIKLAHTAKRQRDEELMVGHDARNFEEQRAIADALRNLAVLERLELKSFETGTIGPLLQGGTA